MAEAIHKTQSVDPAPGMAAGASRLDFERWVQSSTEDELRAELERLDVELASENPRNRAAYERHLVERELARWEQTRTIQARREANLRDLRARDAMPLKPGAAGGLGSGPAVGRERAK